MDSIITSNIFINLRFCKIKFVSSFARECDFEKFCVLLLCFCAFVRADSVLDSIHLKALLQNVRENPLIEARNTESKALRSEKKALYGEYLPKVALGYAYQNMLNPDIFYPERVDGMFLEAHGCFLMD